MAARKVFPDSILLGIGLLLLLYGRAASAQPVSPAQEQDFINAKVAIAAAQEAQAEKYAPEPLKQARDLLVTADNARSFKDPVKFTQASRLARAYAELARAVSELKTEEEKLADAQKDLQKARAELDLLKKNQ